MDNKLIYAVDDEEAIRKLYLESLEVGGYEPECFIDAESFFKAMEKKKPSLIILDVMLGGMDGLSILARLKNSEDREIPVIMVSAKGEEIDKVKGLNLGADDYLAKPFGVLELLARIKANLRRVPHKEVGDSYKDLRISKKQKRAFCNDEELHLTKIEFELLSLLIEKKDEVLTKDEIYKEVYGLNEPIESRVIDIHMSNLRKKISASLAKIETLRGTGYRLK